MGPMPTLNERAHELCDAMVADADQLGVAISVLACGTRLIDCGVKAPGSIEAGRRLAEVCLSGLGEVQVHQTDSGQSGGQPGQSVFKSGRGQPRLGEPVEQGQCLGAIAQAVEYVRGTVRASERAGRSGKAIAGSSVARILGAHAACVGREIPRHALRSTTGFGDSSRVF